MAETSATNEQKAVMPELNTEVLTFRNDVTQQISGFVLQPRDEILAKRGAGKGVAIYQDLKRDAHVKAVLRKRTLAVIAREPQVTPASEDPKDAEAAELVKFAINAMSYDRYTAGMMEAILNGYAVGEIIWGVRRWNGLDRVVPLDIAVRNPRRFIFDLDGKLRLLTPEQKQNGIELPDRKFITLRYGQEETEDPYGLGLGNALFWPVFFKRKGIEFWFKFADRFGQPTTVGKHPPNATEKEKKTLLEAMRALAQEANVALPEGMDITFLEAQRYGSINTYQQLCEYMDGQISEAVLGETLSTNIGDSGSRAASQTHNEVRQELTDADAELICDIDNRTLATWITLANMPTANPPTIWREAPNDEDLKARAERDQMIYNMGFKPTLAYIQDTYGGEWEPRAAEPGVIEPGVMGQDDLGQRGLAQFAENFKATHPLNTLAAQSEDAAASAMDGIVGRFKAALDQSATLEDFAARVLALEPEISTADFAAVLGEAMTVSELRGRDDAASGK